MTDVISQVFDNVIQSLDQKAKIAAYQNDPVLFAKDCLGINLWSVQRDIAYSVVSNKKTIVKAGAGVGKSYLASILAVWWISTHDAHPTEILVASTAPSVRQVHDLLWSGVRHNFDTMMTRYKEGKSPLKPPGYVTNTDIWKTDDGKYSLGYGKSPAKGAADTMQGEHRLYTLAVLDEACSVQDDLWPIIDAITTTDDCRILAIGNPTNPATRFGEIFRDENSNWKKFTISVMDSPNLTRQYLKDPTHQKYKQAYRDKDLTPDMTIGMTSAAQVEEMIQSYGLDSPYVQARVFGNFPSSTANTLFNERDISTGSDIESIVFDERPVLGVDLARGGEDESVIYSVSKGRDKNTGKDVKVLRLIDHKQGLDAIEAAHWINDHAMRQAASEVRYDASGYGAGVGDPLVRLAEENYDVVDMIGSARSPDPMRWKNSRAYWFATFKEDMANGRCDIDGSDKKLTEQLLNLQFHYDNKQEALQIESKKDIKARGLKSPDYADAAMYAMADIDETYTNPLSGVPAGVKVTFDLDYILGRAHRDVIAF